MKHMDENEHACKKNRHTTVCIHCTYICSKKCAKLYKVLYVHVLGHNVSMNVLFMLFNHDRKESGTLFIYMYMYMSVRNYMYMYVTLQAPYLVMKTVLCFCCIYDLLMYM